jgi:diaminopimelate epimerase
MCGNGSRAVARLLDGLGLGKQIFLNGQRRLDVITLSDGTYSVSMGCVKNTGPFSSAQSDNRSVWPTSERMQLYLAMEEPHVATLVPNVDEIDLDAWGARIVPRANCTVVTKLQDNVAAVRTYERGVNRETLSCGTGAVVAAQLLMDANQIGFKQQREAAFTIIMKGGKLRVVVVPGLGSFLQGPAQVWEI